METIETPMLRFKRFSPGQEIDERGNISAGVAFELAKQVGDQSAVFWLGLRWVQNMSWNISRHENVPEEGLQKFRALIASVLALGEQQLSLGQEGDFPASVQYLRDVWSRHQPGMDETQSEAILEAVFHGQAA